MNLRLLAPLVSLGLLAAPLRDAHACATMNTLAVTAEEAIIVWDEAKHEERFVRRAAFRTDNDGDVALLVPTPTQPTLEEVDNAAFDSLSYYVANKMNPGGSGGGGGGGGGCSGDAMDDSAGAPLRGNASEVTVVSEQRVAGQDATTLLASDADALQSWLGDHHFEVSAAQRVYLQRYVEQGWYLTAFRYAGNTGQVAAQAVSMRFETPAPFYPYREAPSASTGDARSLRVYVLGSSKVSASLGLGGPAWTAGTGEWSGAVDESFRDSLPAPLGVPAKAKLSVFVDSSSPRDGSEEVYFASIPDTGTLSRAASSPAFLVLALGIAISRGRRKQI